MAATMDSTCAKVATLVPQPLQRCTFSRSSSPHFGHGLLNRAPHCWQSGSDSPQLSPQAGQDPLAASGFEEFICVGIQAEPWRHSGRRLLNWPFQAQFYSDYSVLYPPHISVHDFFPE
jgi:hypothetical protein